MRFFFSFLSATLLTARLDIVMAQGNNKVPPVCASTTPTGAQASIHELVCGYKDWAAAIFAKKIPKCDDPGQNVAAQGVALTHNDCNKINICHGTAADGRWNLISVARDGLAGHSDAAHSNRANGKVDYFPGVVVPNPLGASYPYPPAKLGKVEAQGNVEKCGAVCFVPNTETVVDCSCVVDMECVDGTKKPLTGSKKKRDGSVTCEYEECDCPDVPYEGHATFNNIGLGEICKLTVNNHPSCEYHCCPPMKVCGENLMGWCDLILDNSPQTCDYDCLPCVPEPCEAFTCPDGTSIPVAGVKPNCLPAVCPTTTTTTTTMTTTTSEPGPCFGAACNDPHFMKWNGEFYDFHGECDLVFLSAPDFEDEIGLFIYIRTKARYEFSFIESAAIRIGDDILEVTSWGQYMLNGISNAELPNSVGPFQVVHSKLNEKQHLFKIQLKGGESIEVKTFKDWVSVMVSGVTKKNFHTSTGLMGEFKTGRMLARDNSTILEDPNKFGNEWQVLDSDHKLFQTYREPQHPQQKCIMPTPKWSSQRRLGESLAEETAQKACAVHIKDEAHMAMCVYDVIASGDLEMAAAGVF